MSYGQQLVQTTADYTTAQSDAVLVSPAADQRVKVASIYVMSATSGEAYFESDVASLLWKMFPGANGGVSAIAAGGQFLFETAVGEDLTFSSDIAGDHFVSVNYVIR